MTSYDHTRSIWARGITVTNRGAEIQYVHPMWGTECRGVLETIGWDAIESQMLLGFVGGKKVALDDRAPIRILDNPTHGWPS